MTIKNIVMAGGAYNGLYIIGALKPWSLPYSCGVLKMRMDVEIMRR